MPRKPLFEESFVLDVLNHWIAEHGVPPTVRELSGALGVGSVRTTTRYLQLLQEGGAIERWSGARGLRPLKVASRGIETVPVPIVGEAPAGSLALAEQNIEGWVRLPQRFARQGARFFLLRVRGNSMNRARVEGGYIESGDLVLVRQQPIAEPGEIVVALIDGQATIKRFARGSDYCTLKPDSTEVHHQPIIVEGDFLVQGVVQRVFKKGADILNTIEE